MAVTTVPESTAATRSMPVPTKAFSGRSTGTAWRCMLAPISARFASSCSRNGTSEAATDTICAGATSMYWMRSGDDQHRFAVLARRHQLVGQRAVRVERRVGLGDDVLAFLDGRQVVDLHRHLAVDHAAVRRLEEAVLVQAGRTAPAS